MPPRIQNIDWSHLDHLKLRNPAFSQADIIESTQISDKPIWHGALRVLTQGPAVESLDNAGEKILRWTKQKEVSDEPIIHAISMSEWDHYFKRATIWEKKHIRGVFKIQDNKELHLYTFNKEEQWKHLFLVNIDEVEFARGDDSEFVAFSRYPSHLMYLGWGAGRASSKTVIYTYKWDDNAEPLSIHLCGGRNVVLAENLKNGLFRMIEFERSGAEGLIPKRYALQSWPDSVEANLQAEVTRVITSDCRLFYLAGSMGIWKLQW